MLMRIARRVGSVALLHSQYSIISARVRTVLGTAKMSHFQKGNKFNNKLIIRQIIAKDDNYKIT